MYVKYMYCVREAHINTCVHHPPSTIHSPNATVPPAAHNLLRPPPSPDAPVASNRVDAVHDALVSLDAEPGGRQGFYGGDSQGAGVRPVSQLAVLLMID